MTEKKQGKNLFRMEQTISIAVGECCLGSMKLLGLLQACQIPFSRLSHREQQAEISKSIYQRTPLLRSHNHLIEDFQGIIRYFDRTLYDARLDSAPVASRIEFFHRLEHLDHDFFEPLVDETFLPLCPLPPGCSRLTQIIQWWASDKTRKAKAFSEMKAPLVRSLLERLDDYREQRTLLHSLTLYEDGMIGGVLRESLYREGRFAALLEKFPRLYEIASSVSLAP